MTQAPVTHAQMLEAINAEVEHETKEAAARALGLARGTFVNRLKRAKAAGIKHTVKLDPMKELRELKKVLKEREDDEDTAARVREQIYGLASRTPEPPKWVINPTGAGKRGVPVMLWSDWHWGEVVHEKEVGGVNKFNSEIAATRVKKLVETTVDLCYNHMGRAKTDYPGAVICLGGDMISGDIHEELAITNDRTPHQAVNDLTDHLAAAIETMGSRFGKLFIPCVVGNHGRSTRKPRHKGRVYSSYEWNIYCNLEREFRRSKNINFMIPEETDVLFSVYGHRYLLTHGDSLGVRGGDGIIGAIGPIMRGSLKVAKSEAQIGRDFDTILMGHWHQMLWLPGAIVNNSLKGYDEYARLSLRAPYSRPSQALWFTHPQHGITAKWEVFLEPLRTGHETKEWVSVFTDKE